MKTRFSFKQKSVGCFGVWLIFALFAGNLVFAQENRGVVAKVKVRDEQGNEVEKQLYDGSFALVIGAIDYQQTGWVKLDGVRNDVAEVAKTLTAQGFTVEQLLNPTSLNLNSTISEFVKKYGVKANNRLLIYYAGHGYTETDANDIRRGYIVPIDAPSPDKFADEFFAKATTMDDIEGFARNIRSKHALFIFDSCFSGTLISRDSLAPSKYISYITEKPVRQFITAGAANQTVPDESTFRRMFVKALDPNDDDNADKNKDGYVTGTEIALYLQEKVIYYRGNAQTPQYGKLRDPRFDQGDFVFALNKKPVVVIAPPTEPNKNPVVVITPPTEPSNKTRAVTLANQALNEMMRGNIGEAEKLANNALQLDNNSAVGYGIRGWAIDFLNQDYASAKTDLESAVRLEPNNALFHVLLAATYQNLKDKDASQRSANKVLQLLPSPKTALDFYARASGNSILKKTDQSISDYSKAIELNPSFALAYADRGYSYAEKKEYDAAIRDYTKAIELNPSFALAYNNRGGSYFSKKEYDAAIRDFTKAIELNPSFADTYNQRALAYGKIGESAKAKADRQKYKELGGK